MDIENLAAQIRRNCAISDAQFWGYYSLCGLLMRYRDLYRSEHGLKPWESIPGDAIAVWIDERERLWQRLEHEPLQPLTIGDESFDPFDVNGLNTRISGYGLVYGGGYGLYLKPVFFLGRLNACREHYDYRVFSVGRELCRDLSTSPAMLQGRCIYVRTDMVRDLLWDKVQQLCSRTYGGLLEPLLAQYGVTRDSGAPRTITGALERMVTDAAETLMLHETGEAYEDGHGEEWRAVVTHGDDRTAEFYLRGIKDLAADTSVMGPLAAAVERQDARLLSFYMVFLDGVRRELFPEIRSAFQLFAETGDWARIEAARRTGYERARQLTALVLARWRAGQTTAGLRKEVQRYMEKILALP
ncbi:MAG: Sfum_1244 family protein [Nitrospirota bacterium]